MDLNRQREAAKLFHDANAAFQNGEIDLCCKFYEDGIDKYADYVMGNGLPIFPVHFAGTLVGNRFFDKIDEFAERRKNQESLVFFDKHLRHHTPEEYLSSKRHIDRLIEENLCSHGLAVPLYMQNLLSCGEFRQAYRIGLDGKASAIKNNFSESYLTDIDYEISSALLESNCTELAIRQLNSILERENEAPTRFKAISALGAAAIDRREFLLAISFYNIASSICREDKERFGIFTKIGGEILFKIPGLWEKRKKKFKDLSCECVIFTHPSKKLQINRHLSPPSIEMIQRTIISLRDNFIKDFPCPVYIYYDHRDDETGNEYRRNLEILAQQLHLDLDVSEKNGLRRQWLRSLEKIQSEFILIVEHDVEFKAIAPPLEELLSIMQQRVDINYIRFARQGNTRSGFDISNHQTGQDLSSNIMRTPMFSNSVLIMRKDFFENIIHTIIAPRFYADTVNDGAGGVEETINNFFQDLMPHMGYSSIIRLAGLSVWGNPGHPAVIEDLGI